MRRPSKSKRPDALEAVIARTAASFDRYTRLYPDLMPRIRAVLASDDPALREKSALLRRAVERMIDGGKSLLARRYGLTPTQARIAVFVAEGGTVADYARVHKVSPQTVRTHLKAVFAKTGTSRQAELAGVAGVVRKGS